MVKKTKEKENLLNINYDVDGNETKLKYDTENPVVAIYVKDYGVLEDLYLEKNLLHLEYKDKTIYFGPMGCRTGFYFVVRDKLNCDTVIRLINETCEFIASFDGEIPGSKRVECGNYLDHNLQKANNYAKEYLQVIKDYTVERLNYK